MKKLAASQLFCLLMYYIIAYLRILDCILHAIGAFYSFYSNLVTNCVHNSLQFIIICK